MIVKATLKKDTIDLLVAHCRYTRIQILTCDAKVFAQMFVEILDEKTRAGLNIL